MDLNPEMNKRIDLPFSDRYSSYEEACVAWKEGFNVNDVAYNESPLAKELVDALISDGAAIETA